MSETVILSKASPRQRSKPRDPPTVAVGNAICDVAAGAARLEKVSGKGKPGSLAMVKELVHRDNSRLVKDLMALLAIREATKEVRDPVEGSAVDADAGEETVMLKNRPGHTAIPGGGVVGTDGGGPGAGPRATKAATTAAAVASLLHHTATKEFSSLAGEIIAIADDTLLTTATAARTKVLDGAGRPPDERRETVGTAGPKDDGMTMMMLHADATAPEPCPNQNSTDAAGFERSTTATTTTTSVATKPTSEAGRTHGKRREPERRNESPNGELQQRKRKAKTDIPKVVEVSARPYPPVRCFLSGPVPASLCSVERSATPVPTPGPRIYDGPVPVPLTLEQKLDKLLESVVKIKADMHRRIDRLGRRVEQIHLDVQLNIDNTDRALMRNDLLLIGIPCRPREDLRECFRAVCRALEYAEQDIPEVDIRRQKVPGGARRQQRSPDTLAAVRGPDAAVPDRGLAEPVPSPPIVVEFMFKTMRDQFYRAYQAKRVLRLSDVGFASERRFFVNEVLTKYNQKLMAEAVRRKRTGQLHSVYTVDGIVYVQRVAGEKGTKVTSFSSMN